MRFHPFALGIVASYPPITNSSFIIFESFICNDNSFYTLHEVYGKERRS